MEDTICLVTGGASGIGAATARLLHARGATVVVADRDATGGQAVVEELMADGGPARFVRCDVSSVDQVDGLIAEVLADHGRLDAAVNAAGVLPPLAGLDETEQHRWQEVVSVNLTGTWNCMRGEIVAMLEGDGGAIVNLSSVAGMRGFPTAAGYSATKHGVLGLTRSAALEYAERGIRVNAVCPGPVDTPMLRETIASQEELDAIAQAQPTGRLIRAEEVASAAVWLCSKEAGSVTGAALPVDGGLSAR